MPPAELGSYTLRDTQGTLTTKSTRPSTNNCTIGRGPSLLGGGQPWRQIWRVAGRESGSPELLGSPRTSPEVPRTSPEVFGDFPGSSLAVELHSNPEVPRKFPKLPRKFPKLPGKFQDFPGGQPLSLGSLTRSPDSQKLSLTTGGAPKKKPEGFQKKPGIFQACVFAGVCAALLRDRQTRGLMPLYNSSSRLPLHSRTCLHSRANSSTILCRLCH